MASHNVFRFAPFEGLLACAAVAASVGCATTAVSRWSSSPVDASGASLQVAAPPALDVTNHPAHADILPACVVGDPRVVAAKAAPPAGVEADADSLHVWLRFAEKASTRVVMTLDPRSLQVIAASDSAPSILEEARYMALSAWPPALSPAGTHRPTSTEEATDNQRGWAGESGQSRRSLPVVARVDSNRSLLAWTEGSTYAGLDVRVVTVGRDGEPLGDAITVPHDGSAIGQPAVAVASSGEGVVAFLDSNNHGFQLLAASLDCTSPATLGTPPVWASRSDP